MTKNVLYLYNPEIGNFYYTRGHPMKPLRVEMTHSLIINYEMHKYMDIVKPKPATYENFITFHESEYIKFLSTVTEENMYEMPNSLRKFNVGEDCPVFPGLFDFCCISTGGSLMATQKINEGCYDIAVNWSGGLHHAKRAEASGFCYVNDIVISILELLKVHERVMYIDIDVHHGDGVEEAFYTTDRVMTVSFHKYGEYFPGTGDINDIGYGKGKRYSVNVPLSDGIDDKGYLSVFKPIISRAIEIFRPECIVLQCGADSIAGDRIGCFNLTQYGHGECVSFVKSFNIPLVLLGGGGYTISNVAKTWTYDTSKILNIDLKKDIPYNEYIDYYGPHYQLTIPRMNMPNKNTVESLQNIVEKVYENLRGINRSPSVCMNVTPGPLLDTESDEDKNEFSSNTQRP